MFLPSEEAVRESARKTVAHSLSVEYYLEKLPELFPEQFGFLSAALDEERPHDLGGENGKLAPKILEGMAAMDMIDYGAILPEDPRYAEASDRFFSAKRLHNSQRHHINGGGLESIGFRDKFYQLTVWALDTYCEKREARSYKPARPHGAVLADSGGSDVQMAVLKEILPYLERIGDAPHLNSDKPLDRLLALKPEETGVRPETYAAILKLVNDADAGLAADYGKPILAP